MTSESLQGQGSAVDSQSVASIADFVTGSSDQLVVAAAAGVSQRKERQWSVVLSCLVATLLSLVTGMTASFSSNVILDLEQGETSPHRLTVRQQSIFAVSSTTAHSYNIEEEYNYILVCLFIKVQIMCKSQHGICVAMPCHENNITNLSVICYSFHATHIQAEGVYKHYSAWFLTLYIKYAGLWRQWTH